MKETGQKQQIVNRKKLAYQSKSEISSSKIRCYFGREMSWPEDGPLGERVLERTGTFGPLIPTLSYFSFLKLQISICFLLLILLSSYVSRDPSSSFLRPWQCL